MRANFKRGFLLVLIIFFGCQTSEETFVDYYNVYTALPPASSEFASPYKHQPIHAYINDRGEIYGTGNAKRFYTTDFFETVHTIRGFGKFGDYTKDGKNVLTSYQEDRDVVIAASSNYGFDFSPKLTIPNTGDDKIAAFYLDVDNGWFIKPFGQNIDVYQIKDGAYTKISTVEDVGMWPGTTSIYFKNELEGCMLIGDAYGVQNLFYTTSDGGLTWGSASTFDLQRDSGNTRYGIGMIKAFGDLVVAYPDEEGRNAYYDHLYLSRDAGSTWEFIKNDKACYQFLDEQTGYALEMIRYVYNWEDDIAASTGYLQKTTDGGQTWTRVSDQVLYADNIYFTNENVGIATSYSYMQVTVDGGQTWHLLLYPLGED